MPVHICVPGFLAGKENKNALKLLVPNGQPINCDGIFFVVLFCWTINFSRLPFILYKLGPAMQTKKYFDKSLGLKS